MNDDSGVRLTLPFLLKCGYISPGVKGLQEFLAAVQEVITNDVKRTDESICDFYDERVRITTPCDTDFFSVDVRYAGERQRAYQSDEGKGLVILVHGLESNSNSSLSTDLGQAYVNQGFDFACINFRGCCGTPNDTINSYHLGFTDDLKHLLKTINDLWSKGEEYEDRPIYLSGFSLGTNVVVKCLGELGEDALSLYNVRGAAVGAAPFDNKLNNLRIDSPGFNKEVYGRNFLKSMKRKAKDKLDQQCDSDPNTDLFDYGRAMSAETIAEYENAYICKVYGFEDNIDYYERTSCKYFLPGVAVPLYLVNAEDDPFFDPSCFPIEEGVDGGGKAPIKMVRTKHGGHLGNLFHQRREGESVPQTSWMPTELARFVRHVHECTE